MAAVRITTNWADLGSTAPLKMLPPEEWPAAMERKELAGRKALKSGLQDDLMTACMIVCDVAEERAWQLRGRANLADWVNFALWIEPLVMAELLDTEKHMNYGGERLAVAKVQEELKQGAAQPLAAHGGKRTKGEQADNVSLKHGNAPAYLASRLKRDAPELAARVEAGELTIRAAAREAGIVRERHLAPLKRHWGKANEEERAAFLAHIKSEEEETKK